VLPVLNGVTIPDSWNDTCVVLIRKVINLESMKDLMPIKVIKVWECIFWAPSHLHPHIWSVNSCIKIHAGHFLSSLTTSLFCICHSIQPLNLKLGSSLKHLR
jgi:hypothetical protein